ncbi:MAG: transposase [Planctomycetaceae bacterium]
MRTSRAATILTDLFDAAYGGVMHCDRAKMYWQLGRLQWCWAHLKRDVQALIDHPDLQLKRLGHDLMRPIQKLFRHWSRCRDGTLTHREMQRLLAPVRREVNALLRCAVMALRPMACAGNSSRIASGCGRSWKLWGGADEQRGGTGVAPRSHLAQAVVRHTERTGQPIRRNTFKRHRHLPPTTARRLHLPDHSTQSTLPRPTNPLTPHRGVNGYSKG